MSHFINFEARGDSCDSDDDQSIGTLDYDDDFIVDDRPGHDGSSPSRHSSPQHSPGLFCTPGPEDDRTRSSIRQSIESNRDQFPGLGGVFSSILPRHARHDQTGTVNADDIGLRLPSPVQGLRLPVVSTLGQRDVSGLREHDQGPVLPLREPRAHMPTGELRLHTVSIGPVSTVRSSESASHEPIRSTPLASTVILPKGRRGGDQYARWREENGRGLSASTLKRRRREQRERSSETVSSDDIPLVKRVNRGHVRPLFSPTPSEQSDRQHHSASGSPVAVSVSSRQSSRHSSRHSSREQSNSPGRSTRATSLASSQGGHPRRSPSQQTEGDDDDDADPDLRLPGHLRLEELEGLSVPGTRLATGKPRWVCRYFLFTFSQSGESWPYQDFVDIINALGGKYLIGRERHADGGYHFHCFVDFERKYEWEDPHKFCVGNRGSRPPSKFEAASGRLCPGKVHGNILKISKTQWHAFDYVQKYGDIVAQNCDRPPVRGPNSTRDDNYTESFSAKTKTDFLAHVKGHSARDFVICGLNIRKTADFLYGIDYKPPETQDNVAMGVRIHWDRYPSVRLWFREYFADPVPVIQATSALGAYPEWLRLEDEAHVAMRGPVKPRPHSLILYGATRLGKTDFARALGAFIYFRGTFNLKKLLSMNQDEIQYMIWDDVSWQDDALKKEQYKNWLGGQDNFTVSDRYMKKADISWSKPCIFLANTDPLAGCSKATQHWLRGNCTIVDLGDKDDHRPSAICESTIHDVVDYAGIAALNAFEADLNSAATELAGPTLPDDPFIGSIAGQPYFAPAVAAC
jgi:hypothetical protein